MRSAARRLYAPGTSAGRPGDSGTGVLVGTYTDDMRVKLALGQIG